MARKKKPLKPGQAPVDAEYEQIKKEFMANFDEAKFIRQLKRMKFVPMEAVLAQLEGKRSNCQSP